MKTNLTIIDDFLPNPDEVRRGAVLSDFGPVEYQGHVYQGVGRKNLPAIHPLLASAVDRHVDIKLAFFRCMVGQEETTTFIHADNVCASMAGVLYLNRPKQCRGGTAFWRHKETGQTEWTGGDAQKMNTDGMDESKWEMESLAGMRYNRLIIYPTNQFHSMYPRANWSDKREEGRLVMPIFFDFI